LLFNWSLVYDVDKWFSFVNSAADVGGFEQGKEGKAVPATGRGGP
jgi:hypothetical protein